MKHLSKIKNFWNRKTTEVKQGITQITTAFMCRKNVKEILADCRGENFVDSGLKILIAVVIGALLLGGLYALFGQTILPTLTNKVKELFNFNG